MRDYIQHMPDVVEKSGQAEKIYRVLNAALESVNPETTVSKTLGWDGNRLTASGADLAVDREARVVLVAIGKAGIGMARGVVGVLGDRVTRGVVLTKSIPEVTGLEGLRLTILRGGHPVPDESSVAGAEAIIRALGGLNERDLVIFLISGGGSALLTKPIQGVSLAEIQTLTGLLLRSGANIDEINTLRKHLDQVKGGRLAGLAAPAHMITLVLSDVIGNPVDTIASGPTVPDATTYADALAILERYGLVDQAPKAILEALREGKKGLLPETLKPGDAAKQRSSVFLVGSNQIAAQAALKQAGIEGYRPVLLTTSLQGEASQAGKFLAAIAREIRASGNPVPPPVCLVAGGETTVTVRGGGRGGRNLELALGAVMDLAALKRAILVTLATDGEDGMAPAAGAAVDGSTLARGQRLGLAPGDYLQQNDSYAYFASLGDLLVTGSTGTNVNDLSFLFIE